MHPAGYIEIHFQPSTGLNKYKCPCCGYYTLDDEADNTMAICDVCFWQDDGLQLHDPNMKHGANIVSLNQARENYKNFGAADESALKLVRSPYEDEK